MGDGVELRRWGEEAFAGNVVDLEADAVRSSKRME
jgi:hypothetical protein